MSSTPDTSASFLLAHYPPPCPNTRHAPTHLPPYVPAQNQWGTDLLLPVVRQWQVVVSTLGLLVVIHEGVQVRKVAVQIYFSEVSPAHQVSVEFGPLWSHRQNLFQETFRLLFPIRVSKSSGFLSYEMLFPNPRTAEKSATFISSTFLERAVLSKFLQEEY